MPTFRGNIGRRDEDNFVSTIGRFVLDAPSKDVAKVLLLEEYSDLVLGPLDLIIQFTEENATTSKSPEST